MPGAHRVLLLHGFDVSLAVLAERARRFGLRTLAAASPEQAVALAERGGVGAVVLPADLPAREAAGLVAALRPGGEAGPGPGLLVSGPEPRGEGREALREAGVAIALWEPWDDALLRYQLNRALASAEARRPRRARRVPCSVPARAVSRTGRREKPGRLYTLSERGLFFETPWASMRGVEVALELRIGGQVLPARGRVALANVPGNLHNPKLPIGIGVQFTSLTPPSLRAIRHAVASVAPSLDV